MMKKLCVALAALFFLSATASAQFADQRTWGGVTGGSANAQTMTVPNFPASIPVGVTFCAQAGFTNTAAATLNISGTGAVPLLKPSVGGAVALTGGEIIVGQNFCVQDNGGTAWQLTSNDSQSATVVPTPQGYLTPCQTTSGTPVAGCFANLLMPLTDVSNTNALWYEPVVGNQVPVFNGANMVPINFAELGLAIPSSRLTNNIYDVYFFVSGGSPALCMGVAWSGSGAGTGTRGTGAGTAQIAQIDGIWTNAVTESCVNNTNTFTLSPGTGTVIASCFMTGNGTVTFDRVWGPTRQWSCQNLYNRIPVTLQAGDSTASWAFSTNNSLVRPSNNNSANSIEMIAVLPQSQCETKFTQQVTVQTVLTTVGVHIGIGWNSTTAFSGTLGTVEVVNGINDDIFDWQTPTATYTPIPQNPGVNVATALEQQFTGANATAYGTQANMILQMNCPM